MTWVKRYPEERLVAYDPEWASKFFEVAQSLRRVLDRDWVIELRARPERSLTATTTQVAPGS